MTESPAVLDVIRVRAAASSKPGDRNDPWSLALVIEGGAVRGVTSAGMALGLEQLGLLHAFDHVFGSSVGSINGAYLIAGQAAMCVGAYYNEMTTREFLDFRRLLRGKPALSLAFVLDVAAETTRLLDWNGVLESRIRLHPVATSVDTLDWVDLGANGFETKADLKEALRASSQYPFLAGPPVELGEGRYMDAGLRLSIPATPAVQAGCTHLLVLRTRPAGVIRPAPAPLLDRVLIAPRLARIDRRLSRLHLDRHEIYAAELDGLRELEEAGIAQSITPNHAVPTISGFEREPERILAAAREGIRSVYHAIEGREPTAAELLPLAIARTDDSA